MTEKMNFGEYTKMALNTNVDLHNVDMDPNALHYVLGIVTEAGELADIYKKAYAYGKPFDRQHIKEELGDLMWYLAMLCRLYDFDMSEILRTNIDKLRVRFPRNFTKFDAVYRDLKAENKILGKKNEED